MNMYAPYFFKHRFAIALVDLRIGTFIGVRDRGLYDWIYSTSVS